MQYTGKPFEAVIRSGDYVASVNVSNQDDSVMVYSRLCPDGSIQVMGFRKLTDDEVVKLAESLQRQGAMYNGRG